MADNVNHEEWRTVPEFPRYEVFWVMENPHLERNFRGFEQYRAIYETGFPI